MIIMSRYKGILFFLLVVMFTLIFTEFLSADLFYSSSEYNKIYNEKVALELELKSLKRQFKNEKANLESKLRNLKSKIESLNKKIAILNKRMAEEKRHADNRIKGLEKRIDILKTKGSAREKKLIEQNRKQQKEYENELKKIRNILNSEREKCLKDQDSLKQLYDAKITELKKEINNLNDELSELKKLTKKQKKELARMEAQANELEKQLQNEIKNGEIRLKRFHDKLIINIDDRISFDSGSAKLKRKIFSALKKIRKILSNYPEYRIVIEGHTDNVPIRTKKFKSNWQLSTARALSVLRYLLKNKKITPSRFSVAGFGKHNPIVPNNSPANRSLNRRVDIVVIPRLKK